MESRRDNEEVSSRLGRIIASDVREVLRRSSVVFALRLLAASLQFAFVVTLARRLEPNGTGLYYLGLATINFAVVFGSLGLENVLLRFTAAHAERNGGPSFAARSGRGFEWR